jgi:predicted lipoprotein with Yx(FWY)xxD motif
MGGKGPWVARWSAGGVLAVAGLSVLAACGSSSNGTGSAPTTSASAAPTASASTSAPGTSFSTAQVAGLGTVLVDARGHTVYVLTADGHHNLACTDASGCTKIWPDLPLPDGVSAAKAGAGVTASLLGTMKSSDGETYPTYHGWLMYEYAADTGPAQSGGEGVRTFGGVWYALTPAGSLVTPSSSASSSSGGYGY